MVVDVLTDQGAGQDTRNILPSLTFLPKDILPEPFIIPGSTLSRWAVGGGIRGADSIIDYNSVKVSLLAPCPQPIARMEVIQRALICHGELSVCKAAPLRKGCTDNSPRTCTQQLGLPLHSQSVPGSEVRPSQLLEPV